MTKLTLNSLLYHYQLPRLRAFNVQTLSQDKPLVYSLRYLKITGVLESGLCAKYYNSGTDIKGINHKTQLCDTPGKTTIIFSDDKNKIYCKQLEFVSCELCGLGLT